MRVLITGASGFIGKSILKVLKLKPCELMLWGADARDRAYLKKYSRNVIIGDLKNLNLFKKTISRFDPQVCVHLAWEGIPDYSFEMSKRNLDSSLGLINFLINGTGCKKITISGSCMEYGKSEGICRETDTAKSNSFFSWAKNSLYSYCYFACEKAGVDLIWFRLFYVYGPGQKEKSLIPSIVKALKICRAPEIDYPMNANDFVNCADVAEAFSVAIKRKIPPGIYNLGSGRSVEAISVCRMVERELTGGVNISKKVIENSGTKQQLNFWADTKRSARLFGWHPQVDILAGIRQYIKNLEE